MIGCVMTHAHTVRAALPPERALRYARVLPGVRAGTIEVRLRPDGDGTLADVVYETTALDDEPFEPHIADWEEAIAAAIGAS